MNLMSKKIISILSSFDEPVPLRTLFFHKDLRGIFSDPSISWHECFEEVVDSGVVVIDEKNCYSVDEDLLVEVL